MSLNPNRPADVEPKPLEKEGAPRNLPAWYPDWSRELADLYFSGSTCLFVLHGNVHDFVYCPRGSEDHYSSLIEFLSTSLFGGWDVVVGHDLGRGLHPLPGPDQLRLHAMMQFLGKHLGQPAGWPKTPEEILAAIDRLIERNLLEEPAQRKRLGFIFKYAEYLVPEGDPSVMASRTGSRLVRFQEWAQNPYIKRVNTAFCLITEKLSEISDRLIRSPHVATLEIPLPAESDRERFANWATRDGNVTDMLDFSTSVLARLSSGLTLTSVNRLLSRAGHSKHQVDADRFRKLKKGIIEKQCQGLIEFVEPSHTLDLLVGHETAKKRLRDDAAFLSRGLLSAAPMGYLVCGPIGTGKTFLAECYAGSIGIPCVKLKNFRSKYVGETEGNLERVLSVLRSLGPVVVIIDEADAALGTRQAEGDSGTSSRVFSMIASQMGDTRYRGRIVWMLLTSRPDLLPIDLKRQGRAEVHIPLFYPSDPSEIREMFLAMSRKNGVRITVEDLPGIDRMGPLSGADIESVVLGAKRRALSQGRIDPSGEDLGEVIRQFIPSAQGSEKEMQEIAAVLECTEMDFLPERWQAVVTQPDGRVKLQSQLAGFRSMFQ